MTDRTRRPLQIAQPTGLMASQILAVTFTVALWGLLFLALFFLGPKATKLFADFGMKLPALTEVMVAVSRWMVNYWYVFLPTLMVALTCHILLILVLLKRDSRWRALGICYALLMVLLPMVGLLLSLFAFWLPLVKLQEGLSK